jgi:hypothetical protein
VPEPTDEAKDAARYRWLRDHLVVADEPDDVVALLESIDADPDTPERFDAAVDIAMSHSRAQGDAD